MSTDFQWPAPPSFALAAPEIQDTEPCLVEMRKGSRRTGNFIGLDPVESVIRFQPDRGPAAVTIGLSEIKSLRLSRSVEITPLQVAGTADEEVSDSLHLAAIRQKCRVVFTDGDILTGETAGIVRHKTGLFLFLVSYGNNVIRCFIPATSLASYQSGDEMGAMRASQKPACAESAPAGAKKQEALQSRRLGDYLQRNKLITQDQIEAALERQGKMPQLRLGEVLVQEKIITEQQLHYALQLQAVDRKKHLGDLLTEMGVVTQETIRRLLIQKLGIPHISLAQFRFDPQLLKSIPAELVTKHSIVPLYKTGTRLVVAAEDPLDTQKFQELAFFTRLRVEPVMASREELQAALGHFYGTSGHSGHIAKLVDKLVADQGSAAATAAEEVVTESDNGLVQLVNRIIIDAFVRGASDIHIENMKGNKPSRIRFRVDGVLTDYSDIPANFRDAVVARIKIMSQLDISERRQSQDGKVDFRKFGPADIELRVVTIPTGNGAEDVVMRLLAAPKALSLDSLGLSPLVLQGLERCAQKPQGLLFVCGPTGSGKTTTLHAILSHINTPYRKIWTVEDPVEITQEGLRQVQVHHKIGWTFPTILRSFLRADPDVIMVGETRDRETAKTVIEASLTGHLVLSTMHTNSAVESVVRLLDFGLDQFNFGDALIGVLGQRLARRLCPSCRKQYRPTDEELNMLAAEYCFETQLDPAQVTARWQAEYGIHKQKFTLHQARGCRVCNETGYKGRLAVCELLLNTPAVKRQIHTRGNVPEMLRTAMEQGMRTIKQDGIEKMLQGETDWAQVRTL